MDGWVNRKPATWVELCPVLCKVFVHSELELGTLGCQEDS